MATITKKQVLAHLGVYAVVRGVVDDKMTFDVCEAALSAKAAGSEVK